MAEKDYSATPLWKKLGMREGADVFVGPPGRLPAPDLGPLPTGIRIRRRPARGRTDVVLYFTTDRSRLGREFSRLAGFLKPDGGLWVSWPKKSSAIEHDLSFQAVQRIGLDAGLVDNKSCSIDADWQALRFVVRREDRAAWPDGLTHPTTT